MRLLFCSLCVLLLLTYLSSLSTNTHTKTCHFTVFPSSSLLCTAQVFAHSNDLNEKDDMILKLKKQESLLETALAATERLQEQDAIVRLQLGKRLEQVLLDKEEAYEELHHFKVMSDGIRHCALFNSPFIRLSLGSHTPPSRLLHILLLVFNLALPLITLPNSTNSTSFTFI